MGYRLWIENEAKTEIRQLPGHVRQQLRRTVKGLSDDLRPHHSRKMKTPEGVELEVRRLRLERWRVIYLIDEEWSEVGVLAIRKRPPYDYTDLPELLADLE